MGRFQRPQGGRSGVDRDFNQPGEEGSLNRIRNTKESEYHGPAYTNVLARGAQQAGQEFGTRLNTTAAPPQHSYRRSRQQRNVSPPPGFSHPGRASQPARSTIAPAGYVTQHTARSTAEVQAPAERLPQLPQRFRNRIVFPEGRAITQALQAARENDKTQNTAPAPAILASNANAKQAPNKVVLKQQATARSASSSSASTPRAPPTPPQPSLPISHQGVPEAAAAAIASLEPLSAPAKTSGGSLDDEASAYTLSSAIFLQMSQRDVEKGRRRPRPPPGVRRQMAAETAERAAAGAQLAAWAVARLRAAAAAADAAQAAADQAAVRAAVKAQLAALALARLRAAADEAQAAADQAAAIAAEFVMLAGAAEAYMEAAPAATQTLQLCTPVVPAEAMSLPQTVSGWAYYCAGAVAGLADGLISLRG